jgi:CheY-like chemotaxis protein
MTGGSAFRLLIVDDEPGVVELLSRVGEACGFEVRAVTAPAEVAPAVASFKPHLVLLDLVMPDMDGIELVGDAIPPDERRGVILVSGLPQGLIDAAARLGRARGVRILGTLRKPVPLGNLRAELDRAKRELRGGEAAISAP